MAKVDQKTQLYTGRFQIIQHLSTVLIGQLLHGLQFQDDLLKAYEVRFVLLAQRVPLVLQCEGLLWYKGYLPQPEFDLQALLIYWFQKSTAFFPVDFIACPDDLVGFLFVD